MSTISESGENADASYEIRADRTASTLYLEFSGTLTADEMRTAAEETIAAAETLTDGFRIINDISSFTPPSPEAAKPIEEAQAKLKELGVGDVVRVVAVCVVIVCVIVHAIIVIARKQHPQFVVWIVEIDFEAAIDEDTPESSFGRLRAHTRLTPHVAGSNRDRSFAVDFRCSERGCRGLDIGVGLCNQFAGGMCIGKPPDAVGIDPAGGRHPTGNDIDSVRGRPRFAGRKRVLVAGEFQTVHASVHS